MIRERKHYAAEEKAAILRRHRPHRASQQESFRVRNSAVQLRIQD